MSYKTETRPSEAESVNESEQLPTCKSQYQSPFLRLPVELRLAIYQLLLCPPQASNLRRISTKGYCSDYVLPKLSLSPSLLATCRQINHEATPLLYTCNTFAAHQSLLTDLPHLVTNSRPVTHGRGKAMIRKWYINVRLDTDPRYTVEKVRNAFQGAEALEVEVFQAMYGSSDFSVLRLYEDVRGVGKCTVHGSVGDGKYARWLQNLMCRPIGTEAEDYKDDTRPRGHYGSILTVPESALALRPREGQDIWAGNG